MSRPNRPASSASRALTTGTLKRFCLTTNSLTPASSQARIMSSASCSRSAIGFSTTTCFPALAQAMTCSRMHSARRQHRNRVDVLSRQKIVDIVMRRNAEFRCDRVGARANRIADGDQPGPIDMTAAQQIGVTLGDASAPEQAKSDHEYFLASRDHLSQRIQRQDAPRPDIDQCFILTEGAANQGIWELLAVTGAPTPVREIGSMAAGPRAPDCTLYHEGVWGI